MLRVITDEAIGSRTFRANAKTWANKFVARVLEPGLVSYEDQGAGKAFLTREAIAGSMDSFIGRPLILVNKMTKSGKERFGHKKVTPATMEQNARGYISGWFVDPEGWFCVEGTVHDDEAKDAIKRVGYCSCGYMPTAVGPGGEHHAVKYQERIEKFSGEHLAIVDRPRYEGATIRLNAKQGKTKMKLMFWKKPASRENSTEATAAEKAAAVQKIANARAALTTAVDDARKLNAVVEDESEEIVAGTEIEIPTADGKGSETVTFQELIDAKHNSAGNGEVDGEDEIDIGQGKRAKLSELITVFNAKGAPAAPARQQAEPPKGRHFRVITNARNRVPAEAANLPTGGGPDGMDERLARGRKLMGSQNN